MITKHATNRMENRAIPPLLVDLLYRYGSEKHQCGSTVLFFDRRARKRAHRALKDALDRFEKLNDAYVVAAGDSGDVITVGHRLERLRNK